MLSNETIRYKSVTLSSLLYGNWHVSAAHLNHFRHNKIKLHIYMLCVKTTQNTRSTKKKIVNIFLWNKRVYDQSAWEYFYDSSYYFKMTILHSKIVNPIFWYSKQARAAAQFRHRKWNSQMCCFFISLSFYVSIFCQFCSTGKQNKSVFV